MTLYVRKEVSKYYVRAIRISHHHHQTMKHAPKDLPQNEQPLRGHAVTKAQWEDVADLCEQAASLDRDRIVVVVDRLLAFELDFCKLSHFVTVLLLSSYASLYSRYRARVYLSQGATSQVRL